MKSTVIRKKAEDLVDQVIKDSKSGLLNVEYRNYVKEFRDGVLSISDSSIFFKSEWVNENGIFDEFAATRKICNYIKYNWNLDAKYRYTVEKLDTSNSSTRYVYKAEFSVPTKQYPIPQVTVSAFFTVEIPHLQLLPVYVKYRLDTDNRAYVVGKHTTFNKNRFEHLFTIKRHVFADINRYSGWSASGPGHGLNS